MHIEPTVESTNINQNVDDVESIINPTEINDLNLEDDSLNVSESNKNKDCFPEEIGKSFFVSDTDDVIHNSTCIQLEPVEQVTNDRCNDSINEQDKVYEVYESCLEQQQNYASSINTSMMKNVESNEDNNTHLL